MSQKTQYDAKCSSCGNATTVPFRPTPNKPVYCRTCFAKRSALPTVPSNGRYGFDPKQAWARRRK